MVSADMLEGAGETAEVEVIGEDMADDESVSSEASK
jgi:hypothetical protein